MITTILAAIGATVLILQTASQLPAALADLLRSLQLVREAVHSLRIPPPNPRDEPTLRRDDGPASPGGPH
jgi:GMP synthase-like glutamine amidotransferase